MRGDVDEVDDNLIAIGEVRSEQDAHFARLSLSKLGIAFELANGDAEIDEIRRFIGGWSAGQMVLVNPKDACRALAAVAPRLAPPQICTDTAVYLEQLDSEQLLKLLDVRHYWTEPVLQIATRVLADRGISYPPDGVSSTALPIIC